MGITTARKYFWVYNVPSRGEHANAKNTASFVNITVQKKNNEKNQTN